VSEGDWFEDTWRYRDDVLYLEQLGGSSRGTIATIPYLAFAQLGTDQVDPRWLHCGVLVFPPAPRRAAFSFVTSGLSNAWDADIPDPMSVSGLGIELRIDNIGDEHWPTDVLLRLSAMQLLVGAGRFRGTRQIGHGDRVKVGAGTFGALSQMTALLATNEGQHNLPSGTFEMIQLFAISDAERELAAERGTDVLLEALRRDTTYPTNDITRQSVV
jgi:hypothetical protein